MPILVPGQGGLALLLDYMSEFCDQKIRVLICGAGRRFYPRTGAAFSLSS